MLQNFKTDIIYYNTATDFELEFNLCGCCRMRLFNDKCADKKTLLSSLSRAFSRSRLIILTAPIFDGSNIIKTVSTAIGKEVEEVNSSAYNINSVEAIEITKGSIPLVTSDGIFGGCIIESGPQTLIILTDNKSVRKNIMVSLIHPYVEEIAKGNTPTPPSEPEDPTNQLITGETEETEEAQEIETPELEPQEMLLTDIEDIPDTEESTDYYQEQNLITETESEEDDQSDALYYSEGNALVIEESQEQTDDETEEDYYYENDDFYADDIPEEKNSAFNIALIVICAILLLAIAVLCFCIFFVPAQNATTPAVYLKEIYDTMFN